MKNRISVRFATHLPVGIPVVVKLTWPVGLGNTAVGLADDETEKKNKQANIMKKKILILVMSVLALVTLVGCGQRAQETLPAGNGTSSDQSVSTNSINTNNPPPANSMGTNASGTNP